METLLGLCIGLGLAAACGFRVFVPLLVLSIGARTGLIQTADGFTWLSSWQAMSALAFASVLEIVAYFWPWLDHALDTIASPAAVVAGTVAAASQVQHMDPTLTWLLGLIAGGGAAAATQTLTVSTRAASTVATGGLLNPVLNAVQSACSAVLSILAVVVPVLGAIILLGLAVAIVRWRLRRRARTQPAAGPFPFVLPDEPAPAPRRRATLSA
jgi:hypothetical protein